MQAQVVDGESEKESRSFVYLTFDANFASLRTGQMLDDRQAESGPAERPGPGFVDAVEPLEQAGQLLGGNPRPSVPHKEFDEAGGSAGAGHGPRADGNRPGAGRVLDRVVEQVREDLMHGFSIAEDLGLLRRAFQDELDPSPLCN